MALRLFHPLPQLEKLSLPKIKPTEDFEMNDRVCFTTGNWEEQQKKTVLLPRIPSPFQNAPASLSEKRTEM